MPQFTAASTSFDGPATTDAALAALAAEAGLIDPEPEKESPDKEAVPAEPTEEQDASMEVKNNGEANNPTTTVVSAESSEMGLFGGGSLQRKLGLKGGSKIRMGLFGGGPPISPFTDRGGLVGGGKDMSEAPSVDSTQESVESGSQNGIKVKDELEDNKMDFKEEEEEEGEQEEAEQKPVNSSFEGTGSEQSELDVKVKEETGDALSALASAALDHSKEFKPVEKQELTDEKEEWFTVGFIKGNSFDVQSYCMCDDDTSLYTTDNLPDLSHLPRTSLEPGTAYKFRVAAINSVGRGEWSEVQ